MATPRLSPETKLNIIVALRDRVTKFPSAEFRAKLEAADKAYHLATRRSDDATTNQKDSYSRFQELDNGLVREVAESYSGFYVDTYIGKNKLFTMTSSSENQEAAAGFNAVLWDQDRKTQHKSNLTKFFIDCAKYNMGACAVEWIKKDIYNATLTASASKATEVKETEWQGNQIKWLDLYNVYFDTTVPVERVHEIGEFAGWVELYSQVQLFNLIRSLKQDSDVVVYDTDISRKDFNIYNIGGQAGVQTSNAHGISYYEPNIKPLGSPAVIQKSEGTDWLTHLYGSTANSKLSERVNSNYQVSTFYMRIVPSVFGITPATKPERVEIWKFWVLDGCWLLAAKRETAAHNLFATIFAQPDADSLGINTSGPTQVAIPYQKTVKQIMDRVLAGADRAIRGKSVFDSTYINSDDLNSAIPDPNIPLKKSLNGTKTIDQIFREISMSGDTTGLNGLAETISRAGLRTSGLNNSQAGQFTKGNRTLEEYSDVQANAVSRQFMRLLVLESTAMAAIKRILKLNILQFQPAVELYDPNAKTDIKVTPESLHQAEVDFVIADAFNSTEYMLSANVQQVLFSLLGTTPQLLEGYKVSDIVAHILQQSMGVNLQQYKMTEEELQAYQAQLAAQAAASNQPQ